MSELDRRHKQSYPQAVVSLCLVPFLPTSKLAHIKLDSYRPSTRNFQPDAFRRLFTGMQALGKKIGSIARLPLLHHLPVS